MSRKFHTVYDKDGNAHEMTYPNARDMVAHAGWKWSLSVVGPKVTVTEQPAKPTSLTEIVKVYDREGNEHEMTWANARDMIANAKWTRERVATEAEIAASTNADTKPATEQAPAAPEPAEKKDEVPAPQPVIESDTDVPAAADKASEPASVNFDEMTKEEIDAWAEKNLGLKLDGRLSKAKMIAAVAEKMVA